MKKTENSRRLIAEKTGAEYSGASISGDPKIDRMIRNKAAEKAQKDAAEKKSNRILLLVAMGIIFAMLVGRLFATPSTIVGSSMNPTFEDGNLVWGINADIYGDVTYNDVVSFSNSNTKGRIFIKRIMGLPGDTIQIIEGHVYRNNELVNEPYDLMNDTGLFDEAVTLGENEYFVLGDNRNNSTDSRIIGTIAKEDIMYVVTGKILS